MRCPMQQSELPGGTLPPVPGRELCPQQDAVSLAHTPEQIDKAPQVPELPPLTLCFCCYHFSSLCAQRWWAGEDQPESFCHCHSPLLVWSRHEILFLLLDADHSVLPSHPESLRNSQKQIPETFDRSWWVRGVNLLRQFFMCLQGDEALFFSCWRFLEAEMGPLVTTCNPRCANKLCQECLEFMSTIFLFQSIWQ